MGDDKCSDCGMLRDECGLAIAPCCDACYKSVGRSHTPTWAASLSEPWWSVIRMRARLRLWWYDIRTGGTDR